MLGARKGRPIAAAPCTPRLWRQNRRYAVPSAYPFRLSGRARGNIPVKPRPQPTSLWAAPAFRERFGDLDATHTAAVFNLTARNGVAGTDESPLEIGEPENVRQGQDAMDGGLRRTETGQNCREQFCTTLALAQRASPRDGTSNLEFRRAAGWNSEESVVRSTDFAAGPRGLQRGSRLAPFARSPVKKFPVLPNIK